MTVSTPAQLRAKPKNTRGRNEYQRKYMAEQRLKNPKSKPDRMRAAFREIVALLGEPKGDTGKQIKALAEQFTMEKL